MYLSIHRDTLWECMKEFKIPTKLINMCKTCTKDKKCDQNRSNLSSFFENKIGPKQRDPLSPILRRLSRK